MQHPVTGAGNWTAVQAWASGCLPVGGVRGSLVGLLLDVLMGAIVSIAGFGPKPSTRFSGWPWSLEGTWRPKADVGDPCGLRLVEALI